MYFSIFIVHPLPLLISLTTNLSGRQGKSNHFHGENLAQKRTAFCSRHIIFSSFTGKFCYLSILIPLQISCRNQFKGEQVILWVNVWPCFKLAFNWLLQEWSEGNLKIKALKRELLLNWLKYRLSFFCSGKCNDR